MKLFTKPNIKITKEQLIKVSTRSLYVVCIAIGLFDLYRLLTGLTLSQYTIGVYICIATNEFINTFINTYLE